MNLLITGGAGFIGSNLVHYLLGEAEEELGIEIDRVVNLDKLTYAGNPANLDVIKGDPRHVFVQGDIGDGELVASLLREHGIDAVMHLAAESHVDRSIESPEPFIQTNVVGTLRLLEAFRKHLAEVDESNRGSSRFLHVSTDEVYGSLGADEAAFCETTSYAPNSPYSASKAGSAEAAKCSMFAQSLCVWRRARRTLTTHAVAASTAAPFAALRKRALHGPWLPQGAVTQVFSFVAISAVAFGSWYARASAARHMNWSSMARSGAVRRRRAQRFRRSRD